MKVSVFGLGYVGCVSAGCIAQNGHKVIGVDTNLDKVNLINEGKATIIEKDIDIIVKTQVQKGNLMATSDYEYAVLNTDISIIAVGTPNNKQGRLNLDYVFKVISEIGAVLRLKNTFHTIAIRSTVMPGTVEEASKIIEEISEKKRNTDFDVLANPEFLREGSAVQDYYNPPFTLIGCANKESANILSQLYSEVKGEIVYSDIKVAEIIKYVNNTYHALKIVFANEVGNICQKLDIDAQKVMEIFVKDTVLNISPYYFKPGFAYGGSCLPKDLKGFQTIAHELYIETPVISNIERSNLLQIQKALDIIINAKVKNIGFLGLSFKAGTDDLRNSPSVSLVESLIGKGYHVKVFDVNIKLSKLYGANRQFIENVVPHLNDILCNDIRELIKESELIVIATKEAVHNVAFDYIDSKLIFDLVRLNSSHINSKNYLGIC